MEIARLGDFNDGNHEQVPAISDRLPPLLRDAAFEPIDDIPVAGRANHLLSQRMRPIVVHQQDPSRCHVQL